MQNILYKIYSVDETLLRIEEHIGRCADCGKAMSLTEEAIVNEFWLEFCETPDPSIYFDLVIDATQLASDQFNVFHEPRLCLSCLKNAIHNEN